jgi:translocation and assembly module TamB
MRVRVRLRHLFWGLALLLIAISAGGLGLLGTETGRLWLVGNARSLAADAGVMVTMEGLTSPSLGHWQAQLLTVATEAGPLVDIHDLQLRWRPGALWAKHLKIEALTAGRVDYYHPASKGSGGDSGGMPQFPMRITLNHLEVQSLALHQLPAVAGKSLPDYRVQASAELFGPDYPVQLQLELHSLATEQTRMSIKTQATEAGEVLIQGSIAEAPGGLLGSLARWPAGDPLQAQVRLSLKRDEQRLHLVLEELVGRVVNHNIKAIGTLDYHLSDKSLSLHELELLVDDKRQRLRGGYSPVDLWVQLDLSDLPLDLVTPWYADIAGGEASGRFELSWLHAEPGLWPSASADLQGEVDYAKKRLVVDLEGELKNRQLALEPSLLRYGTSELRAQGLLDFVGETSDLTGSLRQFHTDLLAPWSIPVPDGLTAATDEAHFRLRGALRQPEVTLATRIQGVYRDQSFQLTVDGQSNPHRAKMQSLHLVAGASDVRAKGTFDWSGGPNDLHLIFRELDGELLRLAPPEVADRVPKELSLLASGEARLKGPLRRPAIQTESRISGVYKLRGEALPYRLELEGSLTVGGSDRFKLNARQVELFLFDHSTLSLSGQYGTKAMDLRLVLNQLPIGFLAALGLPQIAGEAAADIRLTGTLKQPRLDGYLEYQDTIPGSDGDQVPISLRTDVSTEQDQLALVTRLHSDQKLLGQLFVSLPPALYLKPHKGPLPLDLHAEGEWNMNLLRLFADLGPHHLDGHTKLDLTFNGNIRQPLVRGQLQLREGAYHNRATGTELSDITLVLSGDGEQLLISEARARSGSDGELQLGGNVFWQPERRQLPDAVKLSLTLKRAALFQRHDLQGEVAGQVDVSGSFAELLVKGDLEISPFNASVESAIRTRIPQIQVTEIQAAPTEPGLTRQLPVIQLDLRLRADQQAYLRGRGLETELAGAIAVTGTLDNPQYRGLFTTRRGRIDLFGKRFVLEEGEVRFNNGGVILRIPAVHKTQELEIRAELHGTAEEPKLELSSVPALPDDEILSRLIFGKSAQDISAFEAISLAGALHSLTSGGGFDPVGSARSLLGVDSLTIDSDSDSEGASNYTVGIGKYLNERVYVELGRSSNSIQPWSGSLEVELTPRIILESRTNENGGAGAKLLWKKDY